MTFVTEAELRLRANSAAASGGHSGVLGGGATCGACLRGVAPQTPCCLGSTVHAGGRGVA